jgi:3-hydroxymyristoyl/3-hydroxydecanoyl-(acyl carrier protein) dehydratase
MGVLGSTEKRFDRDHPTAAGHFPGNPIIPGALLLDTVLDAIAGGTGPASSCEFRAVKFLRPIRPGDRIRIEWHEEHGEMRFQCVLLPAGEIALTGALRLDGIP